MSTTRHLPEGCEPLNPAELRALAALDPSRLLTWIRDTGSAFLFGIERDDEPDGWGGRYRIQVNRNIELHLIEGFNSAMLDSSELPQFSIMPDDRLAGSEEATRSAESLSEDEEQVDGVVFYIASEDFEDMLAEAAMIVRNWRADPQDLMCPASFPFLPECYFRDTDLFRLLGNRVMLHKRVSAERKFDGRRGFPVTPREDEDLDEEMPPPVILDEEEDEEEDWDDEDWDEEDPLADMNALQDDVQALKDRHNKEA